MNGLFFLLTSLSLYFLHSINWKFDQQQLDMRKICVVVSTSSKAMAEKEKEKEKISKLILKVDLDCRRCYKKIKRVLCKIQDQERIQTIEYDKKKNTVTISGPFDPERLKRILFCKACDVIKDIEIPKPPPPPKKPEPPPPPVVVCPFPMSSPCCQQPYGGKGGRRCCTCGKDGSGCAPWRSCSPPRRCSPPRSCGFDCGGGWGGRCGGCPYCFKIVREEDPCKMM